MQLQRGALPVLYMPARVIRGAFVTHRHSRLRLLLVGLLSNAAPSCWRTSQ